jgi:hypothetical protein
MLQQVQWQVTVLMGDRPQFNSKTARGVASGNVNRNDLIWETVPDHLDCWQQVGISADEHELVTCVLISIIEHVNGDIHIRASNWSPKWTPGAEPQTKFSHLRF